MLEVSITKTSTLKHENHPLGSRQSRISVAGDTYNTAVVLAHLGISTTYLTALGSGPLSDYVANTVRQQGIHTADVLSIADCEPGVYLIDNDPQGERHFSYWRSASAARYALQTPEILQKLLEPIHHHDALYWSGITLALMSDHSRALFFDVINDYRSQGRLVYFDSNFRPILWENSPSIISEYQRAIAHADVYLPSLDDELAIHGNTETTAVINRLAAHSCDLVVMTARDQTHWLHHHHSGKVAVETQPSTPADTTGAGDAFSGALIAAIRKGKSLQAAIGFAHRVAAEVITIPGAILPEDRWPLIRGYL